MLTGKQHSNRELFDFFQSRLKDLGAESALKYRRALSDLNSFLTAYQLSLSDLSELMAADWAADMMKRGLAKTTAISYLNILSSLAKAAAKKGLMMPTDAPRAMAKELATWTAELPPLMKEQTFTACIGIIKHTIKDDAAGDPVKDLMVASLLNGAMPIGEIAALKKGDVADCDETSQDILNRNASPARNYVFDLRQSYLTPRQIHSMVSEKLRTLFGRYVGSADFDADRLVRSLWVACAIRNGATVSEALGCIGGYAPYIAPEFCRPSADAAAGKPLWVRAVNSALTQDMPKWYAMRLRKGVKFDQLLTEIAAKVRPVPEFFYPCETLTRHIGTRKVVEDHPFISQTAFFRSYPERVLPMFHLIGDKAWCYRVHNDPAAPYAVIPPTEMRRFQSAIGVFTPDLEVHTLGELTPQPGESVIVIMAGYGNREARVEEVINKDGGSAIFRVKLSTDQGYEWRMNVDARQLERVVSNL